MIWRRLRNSNNFFTLAFTSKTCSQTTVYISTIWRLEGQATVGKKTSRHYLETLDIFRSMGLDEIFSRVLKEMACVTS